MTTATESPVLSILASHGFASIDDAREGNVIFVCHECGSIKCCTPGEGRTREQERDILIATYEGIDECCDPGDNSIL
jgi:hypothetical protein